MAYLCPLCLSQLTGKDSLEARCVEHPEFSAIFSGAEDPPSFCSEHGCESGQHLGYGDLMCRHIGCKWGRNPFWNGTEVSVQTRVTPHGGNIQQPVSHWEVRALEKLAGNQVDEMWFPARLLVPADRSTRRKRMTLISLCGGKNVGKTYLAMHALDWQGLPTAKEDYIYCYPAEASDVVVRSREFLQTLLLREAMQTNSAFTQHLASTVTRPRNLKVSFFVPESPPPGGLTASIRKWLSAAVAPFSDSVHALMFYDIAGEETEGAFSLLANEHDRCVDVVAVMISAEDLLPAHPRSGNGVSTISAAINRLKTIGARKLNQELRCALLVTKADLWSQASGNKKLTEAEFLSQLESTKDSSLKELLGSINTKVVDRIFFVHPDDSSKADPVIIGLPAFAAWCVQ